MTAPYNFDEWNPTAANQQNDAVYQADPLRSGGAVSGPWAAASANKVLYQSSTMAKAIALMMATKGYGSSDGTTPFQQATSPSAAVTALASVLGNILTSADFSGAGYGSGYVKLGALFGGLILQYGLAGSFSSSPASVTYPIAFPTGAYLVVAISAQHNTSPHAPDVYEALTSASTATIYSTNNSGTFEFYWLALGH